MRKGPGSVYNKVEHICGHLSMLQIDQTWTQILFLTIFRLNIILNGEQIFIRSTCQVFK